jgi:hypothetical protein
MLNSWTVNRTTKKPYRKDSHRRFTDAATGLRTDHPTFADGKYAYLYISKHIMRLFCCFFALFLFCILLYLSYL